MKHRVTIATTVTGAVVAAMLGTGSHTQTVYPQSAIHAAGPATAVGPWPVRKRSHHRARSSCARRVIQSLYGRTLTRFNGPRKSGTRMGRRQRCRPTTSPQAAIGSVSAVRIAARYKHPPPVGHRLVRPIQAGAPFTDVFVLPDLTTLKLTGSCQWRTAGSSPYGP